MIVNRLREVSAALFGGGAAASSVPSFDGALQPNRALDEAEIMCTLPAPRDLATDGRTVYVAEGNRLMQLTGPNVTEVRKFETPLTAVTCLRRAGVALVLDGREIRTFTDLDTPVPQARIQGDFRCVNALAETEDGCLLASDGSSDYQTSDWVWDLMGHGKSGRLLKIDVENATITVLADRLEYAFGVSEMNGVPLVAESWRHRIVALSGTGKPKTVTGNLPVYPSRLSPAQGGGWWLSAFLARTQLVEFVLREHGYRKRMMAGIDPEHWVAPRLQSSVSFKEPMQGAHLKTMGVIKPWAPPRSYGLVIRLDAVGRPLFSLHSRFDGENHGITAAVECGGSLYVLAQGPGRVLRLKPDDICKGRTS